MKPKDLPRWLIVMAAWAVLGLAVSPSALAQTGAGYDLTWSTVDGGGSVSTGGSYTLNGTIGQAEAGMMSGSGYTLTGGFWGSAGVPYVINLPLIMR